MKDKTQLDRLNDFLAAAAVANVGIRRKIVIINQFIKSLVNEHKKV